MNYQKMIQTAMAKAGFRTQLKLAAASGVPQSTISLIATGKRKMVSVQTLESLASACDLSLSEFISFGE